MNRIHVNQVKSQLSLAMHENLYLGSDPIAILENL